MTNFLEILFWLALVFVVLPVAAFMVVKFGTTGYYRAREQAEKRKNKQT